MISHVSQNYLSAAGRQHFLLLVGFFLPPCTVISQRMNAASLSSVSAEAYSECNLKYNFNILG